MLLLVKSIDGLALASLEYMLARHGMMVARRIIGLAGVLYLQLLLNRMRDTLLEGSAMCLDQTVVR